MRLRNVSMACLLLAATAVGAAAPPADNEIVLPISPAVVVPSPMPGAVTRLTKGVRFVATAPVKCDVEMFPDGVVSWAEKTGPRDWTAVFAGGTGDFEDRHFTAAFLYSFAAVSTAKVDVLIIPTDPATKVKRKRFSLDVDAGTAPIPPPKPPPDPIDPPKPPVPVTSFRVVFIYESQNTLTQPQKNVIFGKVVEDYLKANTTRDGEWAGFRRFDKDLDAANDTPTFKALCAAVKAKVTTVPCVAVERNGAVDILPLPPSPSEATALFSRYLGGK